MSINTKIKKGGIDTIIAFVVVLLPLVYILIYMVATLYHFSVQMYLNQVVKETLVMASTYGTVTDDMEQYLIDKISGVLGETRVGNEPNYIIKYSKRSFDEGTGQPGLLEWLTVDFSTVEKLSGVEKADLIGISVQSKDNSLLANVNNFNIFGGSGNSTLKYSAYREEIIRNDTP